MNMAMTHGDSSRPPVSVISVGVELGGGRLVGRSGMRRVVAQSDEDVVTLATVACAQVMRDAGEEPDALLLVSTSAPYREGGSVQPLVELLNLPSSTFVAELSNTARDGLAALRLAIGMVRGNGWRVMVCAAHADAGDPASAAGAVALLLGPHGSGRLGELADEVSHVEELRDRWRLAEAPARRIADRSFVESVGTHGLADRLLDDCQADDLPVTISGTDPRASAQVERERGGPGDGLRGRFGDFGAAHALLRMVCSLDRRHRALALAGGMGDAVLVAPGPGAQVAVRSVESRLAAEGCVIDRLPSSPPTDFDPYYSVPRSWRERATDLRLEGILPADSSAPGREPQVGTVLTWVRDHVYPAQPVTDMAVVELDGGSRFFGQVAVGQSVTIGDRVTLVPRRLHEGGGIAQYFWKVASCP